MTTLSFENLQRDAAWLVDRDGQCRFHPAHYAGCCRHWSETIGYVERVVSASPMLDWLHWPAGSWAGWSTVQSWRASPTRRWTRSLPPTPATRRSRLRRALEFINEHADEPISLSEIAIAARLSPRGLQAAFRRRLDTTPLAHLRSVRMQRAHRDLQNAEPGDGLSVAAVAARWGFAHLGRFAIEYRRRFGIYPSQTLRS